MYRVKKIYNKNNARPKSKLLAQKSLFGSRAVISASRTLDYAREPLANTWLNYMVVTPVVD